MSRCSWMQLRAQRAAAAKTRSNRRARTKQKARRLEALETRLALCAEGVGDPELGDELVDEVAATPVLAAELDAGEVLSTVAPIVLNGQTGDAVEVAHTADMELDAGAVAVTFVADDVEGRNGLFSKDHRGLQEGGHLTAWVRDGAIEVRLQSDERSVLLRSAEDSITVGEEHHVAVSFGENGYRLFVDGLIADADVDFEQGIADNDNPLVLGANAWTRVGDDANLQHAFDGTILDLTVYDSEIGLEEAAALAGLDLSPPTEVAEVDGVLVGTDAGETITGQVVSAGYGDDMVVGTDENDVLEAGAGEDITNGGAGDDLIISRGYGREPVIAQNYEGEDPDGEVNAATRTLYPDQPVADDDLLIGGEGADTFRFEILLNAKERILFEHVEDDGTIDWAGVTGENDDVHDHWVDRIGDDVILDFNREEGDHIEFVGHTTDVYKVEHVDMDGDGELDASIMYVQSNQGANGGAHNLDQLGTVTVFGDLIEEGDYHVHAHANLGIVETIGELGEALAPRVSSPVVTDGESRWLSVALDEMEPDEGPADDEPPIDDETPTDDETPVVQPTFAIEGPIVLSGEAGDFADVPSTEGMELDEGTIVVTFTADTVDGRQTLFSKDHRGRQDGGHLTAKIVNGRLRVRMQSDSENVVLRSQRGAITAGQEHEIAISFGEDGFKLYLDGELIDSEEGFTQGMAANTNSLIVGANAARRRGDDVRARQFFDGTISELAFYDLEADDLPQFLPPIVDDGGEDEEDEAPSEIAFAELE